MAGKMTAEMVLIVLSTLALSRLVSSILASVGRVMTTPGNEKKNRQNPWEAPRSPLNMPKKF